VTSGLKSLDFSTLAICPRGARAVTVDWALPFLAQSSCRVIVTTRAQFGGCWHQPSQQPRAGPITPQVRVADIGLQHVQLLCRDTSRILTIEAPLRAALAKKPLRKQFEARNDYACGHHRRPMWAPPCPSGCRHRPCCRPCPAREGALNTQSYRSITGRYRREHRYALARLKTGPMPSVGSDTARRPPLRRPLRSLSVTANGRSARVNVTVSRSPLGKCARSPLVSPMAGPRSMICTERLILERVHGCRGTVASGVVRQSGGPPMDYMRLADLRPESHCVHDAARQERQQAGDN
jgi:hypothetical protein